jgi:hypothetical protein
MNDLKTRRRRRLPVRRLLSVGLIGGVACQTEATIEAGSSQQALQGVFSGVYAATVEDPLFTAAMGSGSDWGAAFRKFLSDSPAQRLRLACNKTYTVETTVDICRQIIVEGCGPSTIVRAARGVTPFRVLSAPACAAGSSGGAETRFHDLVLREEAPAAVIRFGVRAEAPTHLEDVLVEGFSNGIRFDADWTRSGAAQSNANGWSLNRVTVKAAEHAGVVAFGKDANAGVAELVIAKANCAQVGKLSSEGQPLYSVYQPGTSTFPPCAGIVDASKGGNVWSALWTSGTVASYPGARFEGFDTNGDGQITESDDSGHAVCIGCRKDEAVASVLSKNAFAAGNRSNYQGSGVSLISRVLTNVTLARPTFQSTPGSSDPTPPVMFFTLRDNSLMHVEENGPGNARGSWKGANAYVGWYWAGAPHTWQGVP